MDLASQPRFFVGAAMGLEDWPCFRFIGVFVVGIGLDGADGLVIGGAVLTRADSAVSFSKSSLY